MTKSAAKPKEQSYRQLSDQLADLLQWFESEEIDIDAAVAKYQQAVNLIQQMEKYLKSAENKIIKLSQK